MHETTLAKQLLEIVLEAARRAGAARIVAVRGRVAETEALSGDSLAFHFRAHARGTPAEGARLELATHHVEARCTGCGRVYLPEHHLTLCPQCGGTEAELLGECGVRLESIDVSSEG
jgi:hydrogenase nickel incorporation protein HypA/HybF